MKLSKCKNCEQEFKSYYSKYCSSKCYWISKKGVPSKKKNGFNKICVKCKKEFYVSKCHLNSNKKYCSKSCAKSDNYGFKPKSKKCIECGKDFMIMYGLRNADKTCSIECRYSQTLKRAKIQNEKNKLIPNLSKCRFCGEVVVSTKYCPTHFCGGKTGKCYKSWLSKSRKGKKNPAYRNGFAIEGKRTYTGIHLRACSKYRKNFLEKNNYLFCEVCGINAMGTPKFEVHHIYYASLYPKHENLHDFRNLILVCIQCHNNFHSGKMRSEIFLNLEKERGLKELFAK